MRCFQYLLLAWTIALTVSFSESDCKNKIRRGQTCNFDDFDHFEITRYPMNEDEARLQDQWKDCTAIYQVTLKPDYQSQGNDLGMLPVHGKDTTMDPDSTEYANYDVFRTGSNRNANFGDDLVGEPFRDNSLKQAQARAATSVTALNEDVGAYPLGFKRDVLKMYHAVCVVVKGVENRWVEIMAEAAQSNQQICVANWKKENIAENPHEESCGKGELYDCRSSDNEVEGNGNSFSYKDELTLKFYCRDSCDDPDFAFYWRISASHLHPRSSGEQPDAEDWCMMREGDDFPSTLLQPYPVEYAAPAVFDIPASSASHITFSVFAMLFTVIIMLL